MLEEQANNVSTGWKDVINKFIQNNKDYWTILEEKYSKECEDFKDVLEIYPKKENIFRCFDYFNLEIPEL